MPEEILDLVNSEDEVIGEVLESKANRSFSLIHREVAVLLFDPQKRLLLQKRSLRKLIRPGLWEVTCAGHVLKGEDPAAAAHRELVEELGFDTNLKFVDKILQNQPNEMHFTYFYIGRYSGEMMDINKDEVEEARFFSEEDFGRAVAAGASVGEYSYQAIKDFWQGKFDNLYD